MPEILLVLSQNATNTVLSSSWRVGCLADVVVSGGGGGLHPVVAGEAESVDEGDLPAGHLADEVAAGADAAAVRQGGGASVGVPVDVVDLPDRGVAVRVAAVWSRKAISLASQPSKRRRGGSPPIEVPGRAR